MSRWRTLGFGIVVAVVCVTSSTAATPSAPYYVDQATIDTLLEGRGFAYHYRHVNVYSALCIGVGRYGIRTSEIGLDMYWRFKCDLVATSWHYYTLDIRTTLGPKPNVWSRQILSTRLEH
jgi:hypothetical protein